METIGVRELQQHASAALRRVRRGETLGVTDRGHLVAVLAPPGAVGGTAALVAAGRVRPARTSPGSLPAARRADRTVADVVDELRADG